MFRNAIFIQKDPEAVVTISQFSKTIKYCRSLEQGDMVYGWVIQKVFMYFRVYELSLELWVDLQQAEMQEKRFQIINSRKLYYISIESYTNMAAAYQNQNIDYAVSLQLLRICIPEVNQETHKEQKCSQLHSCKN